MGSSVLRVRGEVREPQLALPPGYKHASGMVDRFVLFALPLMVFASLIAFDPSTSDTFRLGQSGLVVGFLLFFGSGFYGTRAPRAGARLRATGPLQFVSKRIAPMAACGALIYTVAVLLLVFGPVELRDLSPNRSVFWRSSGLSYIIFGLAGLGVTGYFVFAPRVGEITLDSTGVHGRARSTKPAEVRWADLKAVDIVVGGGFKRIRLTDKAGDTHLVHLTMHGSDPVLVAETIAFFLAHPEHRAALEHPMAALALVVDLKTTPE